MGTPDCVADVPSDQETEMAVQSLQNEMPILEPSEALHTDSPNYIEERYSQKEISTSSEDTMPAESNLEDKTEGENIFSTEEQREQDYLINNKCTDDKNEPSD